ncbi:expressed unknown protein [Seminavis robusta]|uniref:Uncharacterized protein n=1 Tax=Seminavis robusta TaxID=568900 RepID=A0A9N8DY44_9STRA|nr:expressed unknown protein [Seminavis robusta]|eukprot:Sro369_g128260.1 n/a (147) ;mRNA; r:54716-55156
MNPSTNQQLLSAVAAPSDLSADMLVNLKHCSPTLKTIADVQTPSEVGNDCKKAALRSKGLLGSYVVCWGEQCQWSSERSLVSSITCSSENDDLLDDDEVDRLAQDSAQTYGSLFQESFATIHTDFKPFMPKRQASVAGFDCDSDDE